MGLKRLIIILVVETCPFIYELWNNVGKKKKKKKKIGNFILYS